MRIFHVLSGKKKKKKASKDLMQTWKFKTEKKKKIKINAEKKTRTDAKHPTHRWKLLKQNNEDTHESHIHSKLMNVLLKMSKKKHKHNKIHIDELR